MTRLLWTSLFFIFGFYCCSNKYLEPDRSQFIKDGQTVPTIQLQNYHSVQYRPNQDSSLALAISISGGGHRSANFSMGILLGLDQLKLEQGGNVLSEIDYLSTVSGGGFTGGAYVAALYQHHFSAGSEPFSLQHYFERQIKAVLKKSYVGTLAVANINPRLWFSYADDGDALEKSIDNHVIGRKFHKDHSGETRSTVTLGDLFVHKDNPLSKVRFPMLVANASLLDKMGIFPFTPDILEQYQIEGYTHRLKKIQTPIYNPYTVPLSVGIKASGSFPVLISNTTLQSSFHPKRKFLHIVDGAMTDNTGYQTALDLLRKDDKVNRKVLLIVDADNFGNTPTFSKKQHAQFSLKVFGRLASSGLDARRIRLEEDIELLGEQLNIKTLYFGFNTFLPENDGLVPSKIHVKKEQKRLIRLLKENPTALSATDKHILYELLVNIKTKYSITAEEQELLLQAGKALVKMKSNEIMKALEPRSP